MTYQTIALAAAGLSVILLLAIVWLGLRVMRLDRLRREFFIDDSPKTLDDTIVDHNQSIKHLSVGLDELSAYVKSLAAANRKNFQKIGFVRFNPFTDAGGSISFALALLDADGNGLVISSLHGREGNRVYAKEIQKGVSKSQLTEEEKEAISIAN